MTSPVLALTHHFREESERITVKLARLSTPVLPTPQWEPHQSGESVSFHAVKAPLWVFGATIATVTLSGGALVSVLTILLTQNCVAAARVFIVAAALCLCLPLTLLIKAPFQAHTIFQTLSYSSENITITGKDKPLVFPLSELDRVIWCSGTEYARIVINGSGIHCSFLVGIARPLHAQCSDLPEIAPDLHHLLLKSGLCLLYTSPSPRD